MACCGPVKSNTARSVTVTGESTLIYDRSDLDSSATITLEQLGSLVPQVRGGGPNSYSMIGREELTNASNRTGINFILSGPVGAGVGLAVSLTPT